MPLTQQSRLALDKSCERSWLWGELEVMNDLQMARPDPIDEFPIPFPIADLAQVPLRRYNMAGGSGGHLLTITRPWRDTKCNIRYPKIPARKNTIK